jgi:hypothetical protein
MVVIGQGSEATIVSGDDTNRTIGDGTPVPGTIRPMLFYHGTAPTDQDRIDVKNFNLALDRIRLWWQREVPGFELRNLEEAELYKVWDDRAPRYRSNIGEYVARRVQGLGWPNRGDGFQPYIYLVLAPGLGGHAGSFNWPIDPATNIDQVGISILSDVTIYALRDTPTSGVLASEILRAGGWPKAAADPAVTPDAQTAAINHELIHAMGVGEHINTADIDITNEWNAGLRATLPDEARKRLLTPPWNIFFRSVTIGPELLKTKGYTDIEIAEELRITNEGLIATLASVRKEYLDTTNKLMSQLQDLKYTFEIKGKIVARLEARINAARRALST